MIRYPKVKNMMRNPMKVPQIPLSPTAGIANTIKGPSLNSGPVAPAMPSPAFKLSTPTLPAIPSGMDNETSMDIGDPKRLSKISTLLKMGRR